MVILENILEMVPVLKVHIGNANLCHCSGSTIGFSYQFHGHMKLTKTNHLYASSSEGVDTSHFSGVTEVVLSSSNNSSISKEIYDQFVSLL